MNSSPVFPRELAVNIRLDDDPRYKGSIHDDAVARSRGYKAALVPGAFVYGHISRLALHAWGKDWTVRGGMGVRFRRPVHNGDHLVMRAGPLQDEGSICRAEVSVMNEDGDEVAAGWIGLPEDSPDLPDMSRLAAIARPEIPPPVEAGDLSRGMPLTTANRILTDVDFKASLRAFGEADPFYEREAVVHSGCLMRLAMGDTNNSFRFPTPVVLTGIETQHFAQARPGQRLAVVGAVAGAYLRKGKHYLESEEFMLADGKLVARFLRTQIYAFEQVSS
ncbi:MaoC family dehydratase [Neorhizobium sp. Rsf11]|uniref:MaoC family dehydratase n=2 Tax=Neorhizobium TaxID=1525371 RepID=A0ABV0M7S0_9HYPH|nr:MaoC family dehydratase [Neorhizobium petrolearium]MCC2611869.1 MaoC family dehydratase [Neorhizobium petrolearium]WGI67034.1 MaoC family dehydratase [Neorhizobium petrolearium]